MGLQILALLPKLFNQMVVCNFVGRAEIGKEGFYDQQIFILWTIFIFAAQNVNGSLTDSLIGNVPAVSIGTLLPPVPAAPNAAKCGIKPNVWNMPVVVINGAPTSIGMKAWIIS